MEYIDFKKLIDALVARPKETEWIEFKHNFHSKEEIGERISAIANSAYLCNLWPHELSKMRWKRG